MAKMAQRADPSVVGSAPLIAFVLLLTVGGGLLISHASPGLSLGATLLFMLVLAGFLNTELALHVILLSMLLSPEIVVGGVAGISIGKPENKGDLLVLRIEDLVLVAVALAWFARTAIFKELGLVRKTPLNRAIFVYIISLVIPTLLGVFAGTVSPIRGFFFTLKYVEYLVVYFLTVNYVRDERQVRRLLTTAFVTCAIAAIMGIAQIPSGDRVAAPFEGQYGEPNTFGGYLVFMLALILGMALTARAFQAQLGWFAFAGVVSLPLLYTLSRTSWMAAVPMFFTLILLSRRRLILMVGIGILIIVGPLVFPKQVVDRYDYTFNARVDRGDVQIAGARLDTSSSARIDSWKTGFEAWTKRPIFGYGVAGFGFIDAQYIRVLVEGGLLGIGAFLWLLWRVSRVGWNAVRNSRGTRFEGITLGYMAGLVAMIVHGVGANTFIIVRIMEPLWFLTGVVAVLALNPRNDADTASHEELR